MRITKGGISRNIAKERWNEYSSKGYVIEDESEFSENSLSSDVDNIVKTEETEGNGFSETNEAEESFEEGSEPTNFDSMTVAELKVYAENNNIDIGKAERKADILKAIIDRA